MDYVIQEWIDSLIESDLKKQIAGKKVYIWGAFVNGKCIRTALKRLGIITTAYIDGHKKEKIYDGLPIIRPNNEEIKKNSFIIISVVGIRKEIVNYLLHMGLSENIDYIYISKKTPRIILSYCEGNYEDKYGNKIIVQGNCVKCGIELVGYNNNITIGENFETGAYAHIRAEYGAQIIIKNNVRIENDVKIEALDKGLLKIGESCLIGKDSRICSKGAILSLGNYVTVGSRFFCINGKTAYIEIGDDCMFSNDVSVIASGGHSILNLDKKENESISKEKGVIIEEHVWLGKNVTVLYNSQIREGSIVGANSLVKMKTPKRCIVAGNPAKIIKTNYTWDRRSGVSFDEV